MNFSDNGIRFSVKFYVENHMFWIVFSSQLTTVYPNKSEKYENGPITWKIEKSI